MKIETASLYKQVSQVVHIDGVSNGEKVHGHIRACITHAGKVEFYGHIQRDFGQNWCTQNWFKGVQWKTMISKSRFFFEKEQFEVFRRTVREAMKRVEKEFSK